MTVVQWCSGAVVQWCSGAVVQWCSGAVSSDAVRSIGSSTVHFKFSLILPPEALATFEKETWVGDRRETLLLSRSFLGAWGYIADQSFAVLFAAAVSGTAHHIREGNWVGDRRETHCCPAPSSEPGDILLTSRSRFCSLQLTAHCSLHHRTTAPLHHLHHCTTALLHHRTTASPHHCTTSSLLTCPAFAQFLSDIPDRRFRL